MKYIITNNYILLVLNTNKTIKIMDSAPFYTNLILSIETLKEDELLNVITNYFSTLYNTEQLVDALEKDEIIVKDNCLIVNGYTLIPDNHQTQDNLFHIFEVFIQTKRVNQNFQHLKPFIKGIADNTFIKDKKQLASYLANDDFEITEDGYLLAYKSVDSNFRSHYDGTTLHKVGSTVEVKDYDSNNSRLCSKGLHFATKSYIRHMYGHVNNNNIVLVKIHPTDIIAIPEEADNTKGRCRKYEIVEIFSLDKNLKETTTQEIAVETTTIHKKIKNTKDELNVHENRLQQTKRLMDIYKDKLKVSELMGIAVTTVDRNLRKFRAKYK